MMIMIRRMLHLVVTVLLLHNNIIIIILLSLYYCSYTTTTYYSNNNPNVFSYYSVTALASTSSSSSGKARRSGATAATATGFGKPKVMKGYDVDTSTEIRQFMDFLLSRKSQQSSSSASSSSSNDVLLDGLEIGISNIDNKKGNNSSSNKNKVRRGVYATKNFHSKEKIICKVPSALALALNDPSNFDPAKNSIVHAGLNFLKTYRTNANTANYDWAKPYLNILPQKVDTEYITPDYFTDDEIQLLEFPRIIHRTMERKQLLHQVLLTEQQEQQDQHSTTTTLEELQYATWLVSTRSFPIAVADTPTGDVQLDERGQVITKVGDIDDNKNSNNNNKRWIRVLIPYIDLVNHSSDKPNVKLTILDPHKDDAYFALEVIRPIKAGQEVLLSKGSGVDSTIELFCNHGIIVPSINHKNPMDTYMLKKGGSDCINSINDWTTSLEDDLALLKMLDDDVPDEDDDDNNTHLRKILQFRIQLKQSYPQS